MIAIIFWILVSFLPTKEVAPVVIIPAMPSVSPAEVIDQEWDEYHAEAVKEYADEFTALFNSYETKVAKNGAMMIRRGNSGSFKFAKKG